MNKRIFIDLLLLCLFLTAMSFRIIGGIYHEITGIVIFVLFIIHNVINIQWYKNLNTGEYKWKRRLILCINLMLIIFAILLILTGILHSKELFHLVSEDDNSIMGSWKIHSLAAYWTFLLISIHLGIYWSYILNKIYHNKSRIGIILLRVSGALFSVYGVVEFIDRKILSKLVLYYSFDFWHTSEPLHTYLISYLSIMTMVAFLSYYFIRFRKRINNTF